MTFCTEVGPALIQATPLLDKAAKCVVFERWWPGEFLSNFPRATHDTRTPLVRKVTAWNVAKN